MIHDQPPAAEAVARTVHGNPRITIIIATHNRKQALSQTLDQLSACGSARNNYEIIIVDNGSTDGTVESIAHRADTFIAMRRNLGSCAKAKGVQVARGLYTVFLDDDSSPRPGSLDRMIRHFEFDPLLAAAGFSIHLPDGRLEGSALPGVFVGCGVGFRTAALRAAGGLDSRFFMQAEEYDLCFRLVNAGWRIGLFDDLHVDHQKTSAQRRSTRTTYYDTRNNLLLAARYLPQPYCGIYREDWQQRYRWLAMREGNVSAFFRGRRTAALRAPIDRGRYWRWRLSQDTLEFFFSLARDRESHAGLTNHGGSADTAGGPRQEHLCLPSWGAAGWAGDGGDCR